MAIQYAAKIGNKVVALSSSASEEKFARDLGASEYIDGSKTSDHEALLKVGGAALIVITALNPAVRGDLQNGLELFGKLLLLSRKAFLQFSILLWKFPTTQRRLDQLIADISLASGDVTISTIPLIVQRQTVAGWPPGQSKDLEEGIDFAAKNGIKCLFGSFTLAKANEAFDHIDGLTF